MTTSDFQAKRRELEKQHHVTLFHVDHDRRGNPRCLIKADEKVLFRYPNHFRPKFSDYRGCPRVGANYRSGWLDNDPLAWRNHVNV